MNGGDWTEEYARLLRTGRRGYGAGGDLGVVAAAVDLADSHQDTARGVEARKELINVATYGGKYAEALAAFAWCLGTIDADPELAAAEEEEAGHGDGLYWMFKWIIEDATAMAEIPRAGVEEMYAEMRTRYDRLGLGAQALDTVGGPLFWHLGEDETSFAHTRRALTGTRDDMSDCAACMADAAVVHHLRSGTLDDALTAAGPVLVGRLRCAEVPKRTLAKLLVPLLAGGRGDEAMDLLRRLLPMLKAGERDAPLAGDAIRLLALTGNLARARELFTRFAPGATLLGMHDGAWNFTVASEELLACLQAAGARPLRARLPAAFTPDGSDGELRSWPLADLTRAVTARALAITAAFDRRNGNDRYSRRRAGRLTAVEHLRCDLPLRPGEAPPAAEAGDDA